MKLTVAANQFIAHRQSTGYDTVLAGLPWFTDWGRDTMISYTGLTLCTGRFEKAHDILLTFAKYCKDGSSRICSRTADLSLSTIL